MNDFFPPVRRWHLPRSAFAASMREMAIDGALGNEGVALWLGHRTDGDAEVTHVVALRGPGVTKGPQILIIASALLNDVADVASELGVSLVGQIHSHGTFCGTDLSPTDHRYGIRVLHYLSVVAPHFAQRPAAPITDCGVHVFEQGRGFRRLGLSETRDRLQVSDGRDVPVVTIGG